MALGEACSSVHGEKIVVISLSVVLEQVHKPMESAKRQRFNIRCGNHTVHKISWSKILDEKPSPRLNQSRVSSPLRVSQNLGQAFLIKFLEDTIKVTNVPFGYLCINVSIPATNEHGHHGPGTLLCHFAPTFLSLVEWPLHEWRTDLELGLGEGTSGGGAVRRNLLYIRSLPLSPPSIHLSITSIGRWVHERQIFNLT